MKGPFQLNRIYAIASVGKFGFAGGLTPAVYAYDRRSADNRFFTIGEDEIEHGDVYDPRMGDDLKLDSADEAAFRVPERQVLSLWSEREEALKRHQARSARGKVAAKTAKGNKEAARKAAWQELEDEHAKTPGGRIEAAHPRTVISLRRRTGIRPDKTKVEIVNLDLRLSPGKFREIAVVLGIDSQMVEEFLAETEN